MKKKLIIREGLQFSIKNWDLYQHYGDRNPPWIKLYNSLLDDQDFFFLSTESKLLYIVLLLFASKTGNCMALNFQFLSSKTNIHVTEKTIKPLFEKKFLLAIRRQKTSRSLARRKQDATLDQNREEEKKIRSEERQQNPFLKNFKKPDSETTVVHNKNFTSTKGEIVDSYPQVRDLVEGIANSKSWPVKAQ